MTKPLTRPGIAFYTPSGVFVVPSTGGSARAVPNTQYSTGPTWSPDGSQLAFSFPEPYAPQYGQQFHHLYVESPDGSGRHRLTNTNREDVEAAWSPDGRSIAFAGMDAGMWDLHVINADGSGDRKLTANERYNDGYGVQHNEGDHLPSWSPDGTRILFFRSRPDAGASGLYTIGASGGAAAKVAGADGYQYTPSWSPDGTQIAYSAGVVRSGPNTDIFVMHVDGSCVRQLTSHRPYDSRRDPSTNPPTQPESAGYPYWAPDGASVAFASNRDNLHSPGVVDIYVVPADGGAARRVTSGGSGGSPRW